MSGMALKAPAPPPPLLSRTSRVGFSALFTRSEVLKTSRVGFGRVRKFIIYTGQVGSGRLGSDS